jgi:AraC family transcriptional regulator
MEPMLRPGEYYGTLIRSREAHGFLFTETTYPPDHSIAGHSHENPFFYYVLQGASTEVYGRRSRTAAPGALVFHPGGEPHANHWLASGGRCLHLEITPAAAARLPTEDLPLSQPLDCGGGPATWLASQLAREFHRADGLALLALEGLTLELLAEVVRGGARDPEPALPRWLRQTRERLDNCFADCVSLVDLAADADVHPAHLARTFRRYFGCSVGDYIRRRRIEFAGRQLATSDLSLVEVALNSGFADQSHFCKLFKRVTGLTPGEYRRCFRRGDL